MKKPVLLLVILFLSFVASAQKVYFVYFQSEDQTPFYVKLSDKMYSSAESGFLVISNLADSTYRFTIGSPYQSIPEARYTVQTNSSDRGLILRKSDEGPLLFDMQSQTVIRPDAEAQLNVVYETKSDKFSTILSKAADDPSLLKVAVQPKEDSVKQEEKQSVVVTDSTAAPETTLAAETQGKKKKEKLTPEEQQRANEILKTEENAKHGVVKGEVEVEEKPKVETEVKVEAEEKPKVETEVKVEAEGEKEEYKRSVVTRRSETSTSEGFGLLYFDILDGSVDTIRLLIPNNKINIQTEVAVTDQQKTGQIEFEQLDQKKNETKPKKEKKRKADKSEELIPEEKVEVKSKVEEENKEEEKGKEEVRAEKEGKVEEEKAVKYSNTSCLAVASEKDFFKLRKSMAGKLTDELMIDEAKKSFRKMCFTTEQIKHLSSLFLTSAGKYQFFDAAYDYATDKEQFTNLKGEISDEYYLKRFKALIGE